MASSSSSSNMALPRANGSEYDVFISFRGEDTRHSFTDHLYNTLKQAGILTFRDSDDAERGEELKEEIEKAIKASDASIIVLSGNYATSTWCLDELSLILDQRRDCNHFVLPVFYNVDPSNVGKQKGSFEIQADPSRRRWTDDNVKRWKAALTEVVGVIGMTPVGSETKFIKEVVDTIYNRLDRKQIHIPANITGMDVRYEEINSLLKQSEAQFLVICGMAGSGKSTMAQFIVYSEGQQFESNSIVEKIGTRCKNSHEMVVLQEQLCSDISKGKLDRRIDTVCKGTAHIEVLLEKTKALIVLDEIVEERHLEELLGSGIINKESKIIITTNSDISNWFMSRSMRFHKYIMRLLNDDEALELLSLHAFRSKLPKDGYTELAQQVVRYCGGNPLSLEVLGSSLSEKDTITSWKSELSSFEKSFDDRMYEAFIRSYNSLPSSSEKELFLHIACFFVGRDMNYVVKILEPDYGAESKINTLTRRCFLYVTPDNKLMMHRLLQEMGRSLVDRESRIISERTRVWRNKDSYEILRRKKISNTIEGLALDIRTLVKEDGFESRHLKELSTDSLQQMDQLKLLQLKFVKLTGSYEDLSEHLRWLYWVGFDESSVRTDIYMGNMVALDMSYSHLKEFEPPMNLPLLKILNLKDSHKLSEICNFHKIPNLETLILWNCHNLVRVCRTIGNLERLALLNTAGCEKLFNREELSFPLPRSLQRAFLNDCNLECTDYFPLSFIDQLFLQYINLANGQFESLPSYKLLTNLRVLDLRKCSRLQRLLCLPSTLAELYIYDCESIEKITFESGRFTLQEFGYEGCVILSEIEGWVKLLLITKLDGNGLEHMFWLKDYQHLEVCLVGDYELTKGRSCHLQMLYEFNIMSTSLPDIKHPKLTMEYTSRSTSLSFDVPLCPTRCRIKGLNVTFRYTISGDDWVWFVKIHTTKNVDLMYHPKVFGKPGSGNIGRWLSYWPIGNLLDVGDVVEVSIAVLSGLEVIECGASLVYTDDDVARDTVENKTGWVEAFGEDLYRFKLINGSYYLCQRDIYKLTQVGRLTPGWLSTLTGYTIDDTAVRGWRMTGRPQQSYQSFKELKTIRCITHEPDTYYQDTIQQQQQTQSRLGGVWDRFWSFFYQDTMSKNEVGEFKKDGLLRYHDIGKHGYGEYSMAVIQANQVLEDQCQIESGNFGTFVGVYDGHGGPDVARYACDNLFRHFQANSAESHGIVTPETIKKAFLETEKGFTSLVSQLWNSRPDIATVGSCCLVGVVYQQTLFVANVGDSRVVLGRKVGNTGGITAIQLSKEHNANLDNIRRELRDMHPLDPQIVVLKHGVWRVKGIIQVSRSIGDVYMKHARYNKEPIAAKFRLPEQTMMPILSASPSTLSHPIQPSDSFLIFASDGLWEHLSNDEAVDIVHNSPRAGVAKRLVKAALHEAAKKREMRYSDLHKIDKRVRRHFHDDTTVIVLFLNHDLISRGSPIRGTIITLRLYFRNDGI